jgi:hypothetical protein
MEITFFKAIRSTTPEKTEQLSSILEKIKNGEWKNRVIRCQTDIKYKNYLPVFTPTGIFSHRSIKGLQEYNGIICLDIDGVQEPDALKEICKSIPWVMAAFITPSGKGLKVIVKTQATVETYKETELEVAEAFLTATGVARDNHCKDIARIQFVSYDPDLYYNPESLLF